MEGQRARVGGQKAERRSTSRALSPGGLGRPQPRRLWLSTGELTGSTPGSTHSQAEEARETAL